MSTDTRAVVPRIASILFALLCLVSVGCQQQQLKMAPVEVHTESWTFGKTEGTLLTTPHYRIYTTLTDPQMLAILPRFMETAHRLYAQLLPVAQPSDEPSNLYVFRTRNEWEAFTRRFTPSRASTYFRIRSGGYAEPNGTVVYYLKRYVTFAVIAHEGFHMYVFRNFQPNAVPAWLNEGLASYCEGHEWQQDNPVFTPGVNRFRMNSVRRALIKGSLFKLDDMLGTNAGKVIQSSSDKVETYYAQAWSMVTFLMQGPRGKYAPGFQRLRTELGTEEQRLTVNAYIAAHPKSDGQALGAGEALFRSYITEDLEGFNADYGLWLRKLTQPSEQSWRLLGADTSPPGPCAAPESDIVFCTTDMSLRTGLRGLSY